METFNISVFAGGKDCELFTSIINQGIDAHLEAFTDSKFEYKGNRLHLDFAYDELPILLRRLRENNSDNAVEWAEDIENCLTAEK